MAYPIGFTTYQDTSARDYMVSRFWFHTITVTVDSSARDGGNTPTTTFRKGFALGRVTATGRWMQYDNTGGDGRETARAILDEDLNLLDENGTAQSTEAVATICGYVQSSKVFGGSGSAVDSNGITDLSTGANGCLFIIRQYT